MTDLATLVVKLEAQTAQFTAAMTTATKEVQDFSGNVGRSLLEVAGNLAGLVAGGEILKFTNDIIQSMGHLNEFSKAIGISTESLSGLQFAAKQSGVDDLSPALERLSKSAAGAVEGNEQLVAAFKTLGVNVKDTTTGAIKPADTLLLQVADSFSKYSDGATKAAIAQQLFGRGGAQFIALLDQGSDAIKRQEQEAADLGAIISGPTAKAASDFENNINKLKAAFTGLFEEALAKVLPQFIELTDELVAFVKEGKESSDITDQIAAGLKLLASAAITVGAAFEVVGKAIGGAAALATQVRFPSAAEFIASPIESYKKLQAAQLQAKSIAEASFEDIGKVAGDSIAKISKLWGDQTKATNEASDAAVAAKPNLILPDLKAQQAMEKAVENLTRYKAQLEDQVVTFGLGTAASTEFSVTQGKLSIEIGKAGAAGQVLGQRIIELARELEALKNQDAIEHIDIQIQQLTGHTVEAAAAAFDLSTKTLRASLNAQAGNGVTGAGAAQLGILQKLNDAQEQLNGSQKESLATTTQIGAVSGSTSARIVAAQEDVNRSAAAANETRKETLDQLQRVATAMAVVANQSKDSSAIQNAKDFQAYVNALAAGKSAQLVTLKDLTASESSFSELQKQALSIQDQLISKIQLLSRARVQAAGASQAAEKNAQTTHQTTIQQYTDEIAKIDQVTKALSAGGAVRTPVSFVSKSTSQLADIKSLIDAQGKFNDLQDQAAAIEGTLADKLEAINKARASGSETAAQALGQEVTARTKTNQDLVETYNHLVDIAKASRDPGLIASAERFGQSIQNITNATAEQLRTIESSTVAQAKFNELQNQAATIQGNLAEKIRAIEAAKSSGFQNAADTAKLEAAARTQAAQQLDVILQKMKDLAKQNNIQIAAPSVRPSTANAGAATGLNGEQLDQIKALDTAQTSFNNTLRSGVAIEDQLASGIAKASADQKDGILTADAALKSDNALRKSTVEQLDAISKRLADIAAKSGDPALISSAAGFKTAVDQIAKATDSQLKSIRDSTQAQLDYNALQKQALDLQIQLADKISGIEKARAAGTITAQQAAAQEAAAQQSVSQQLDVVRGKIEALGKAFGPGVSDGAAKLSASIAGIGAASNAQLLAIKGLTAAQKHFNDLQSQGAAIEGILSEKIGQTVKARSEGSTNSVAASKAEADARSVAIGQLEDIYDRMEAVAKASSNPALLANAAQFKAGIDALKGVGDTELDTIEKVAGAQSQLNTLQVESLGIQDKLAGKIKEIELAKAAGSLNATQAAAAENSARQEALAQTTQLQQQLVALTGAGVTAAQAIGSANEAAAAAAASPQAAQAGLDKIAQLKQLTVLQAEYTEKEREFQKVESDLALQIALINEAQMTGAINSFQAEKQLSDARKNAYVELGAISNQLDVIAQKSGNPALVQNAQRATIQLTELNSQTDALAKKLSGEFSDAASNAFTDFVTGSKSASDAVLEFLVAIEKQLVEMVAKNYFSQLFSTGSGGTGGGGAGGYVSLIASLFSGGAHATGGDVYSGRPIIVGEDGPEAFVPKVNGSITPNNKLGGGGTTVHQYFTIEAPKGTVSRATQAQVGAAAARSLQGASARNN